jgi:hypothetical protein
MLPGKREALLAAGAMLFQEGDESLEDTSMEYGDGLAMQETSLVVRQLRVVLAVEVVLPLHEHLVGQQGLVLVIRDLQITQETQVLDGSEALVLVELGHDLGSKVPA